MVIVDTSIIFKWITDEDSSNSPALVLLEQFLNNKKGFLAPDIVLYELANALSTKTSLSLEEAEKAWNMFERLHLTITYPKLPFIKGCLKFSKKQHISVYDASYIVLAQEKKCNFITADAKLVNNVKLPFVKLLKDYKK